MQIDKKTVKFVKTWDGLTLKDKHQHTTKCINHLADSAKFKGVTFNKICVSLKGSCFQSPNDTIHVTRYEQVYDTLKTKNGTTSEKYKWTENGIW